MALLLAAATAASAQTAGSYEINGFGRYTRFDNTLALSPENKFGGGGSLGFFLLSNLALEAEGAYTTGNRCLANSVTNIPLRGRLSYHIPLGGHASSIRLGAGYVRNLYRNGMSFDDDGFTGIFGLRLGLTSASGPQDGRHCRLFPEPRWRPREICELGRADRTQSDFWELPLRPGQGQGWSPRQR